MADDTPPLTEAELAKWAEKHVEFMQPRGARQCRYCGGSWPCPTLRLIADLRASRADAKRLRAWESEIRALFAGVIQRVREDEGKGSAEDTEGAFLRHLWSSSPPPPVL